MAQAIRTRYLGWTATKPARYSATTHAGHMLILSEPIEVAQQIGQDGHALACKALMAKMGWTAEMVSGGWGNDQYWVALPANHSVQRSKWEGPYKGMEPHTYQKCDISDACSVCGKSEIYAPMHGTTKK